MDVVGGLCLLACSWWVCEPRRTVKWLQNEESVDWWNKRLLESLWGDEIATPEGSMCPSGFCFLFFLVNTRWQLPLFGSGFVEADGYLGHSSLIVLWQMVILFLVLHVDIPIYWFVKLRLWLATSPCLALGFIGFHARQIWLFPSSVCRRGRLCFLSIPGIFLISTLLLPTDNPVVSFLCLIRLAHSLFSFTWWTPPVSKGYFPREIRGMMAIIFKSQWREKEE